MRIRNTQNTKGNFDGFHTLKRHICLIHIGEKGASEFLFRRQVVQCTTICFISSGQVKDCCMSYNNLSDLEAIELLLAGIVVFFATVAWKRPIFLHNVA
ncbi:hypothetical protein ASD40_26990 [Paenibacillus sp. Root444D2]|nr:hypothetical protein ASD40_26990 [Paenibacillus sp. Root444D2]